MSTYSPLRSVSNEELIDSYINFKLHYENHIDEMGLEGYYDRIVIELNQRGIEVQNLTVDNDISKFHSYQILYNPDFEKNVNEKQINLVQSDIANKTKTQKQAKIKKNDLIEFEVMGNSMVELGIYEGDTVFALTYKEKLTFEELLEHVNNKIIIANLNGNNFIKTAIKQNDFLILKSHNTKYYNFKVTKDTNFELRGIVIELRRKLV